MRDSTIARRSAARSSRWSRSSSFGGTNRSYDPRSPPPAVAATGTASSCTTTTASRSSRATGSPRRCFQASTTARSTGASVSRGVSPMTAARAWSIMASPPTAAAPPGIARPMASRSSPSSSSRRAAMAAGASSRASSGSTWPVGSATAMVPSTRGALSSTRYGSASTSNAMLAGMISTPITKPLVATVAMNSRRATHQTFLMPAVLPGRCPRTRPRAWRVAVRPWRKARFRTPAAAPRRARRRREG